MDNDLTVEQQAVMDRMLLGNVSLDELMAVAKDDIFMASAIEMIIVKNAAMISTEVWLESPTRIYQLKIPNVFQAKIDTLYEALEKIIPQWSQAKLESFIFMSLIRDGIDACINRHKVRYSQIKELDFLFCSKCTAVYNTGGDGHDYKSIQEFGKCTRCAGGCSYCKAEKGEKAA